MEKNIMNHHDRWMHENGNDLICVKCGDARSIDKELDKL